MDQVGLAFSSLNEELLGGYYAWPPIGRPAKSRGSSTRCHRGQRPSQILGLRFGRLERFVAVHDRVERCGQCIGKRADLDVGGAADDVFVVPIGDRFNAGG